MSTYVASIFLLAGLALLYVGLLATRQSVTWWQDPQNPNSPFAFLLAPVACVCLLFGVIALLAGASIVLH